MKNIKAEMMGFTRRILVPFRGPVSLLIFFNKQVQEQLRAKKINRWMEKYMERERDSTGEDIQLKSID